MKPSMKKQLGRHGLLDDVLNPQEEGHKPTGSSGDEIRATFIVDRHKLQLLKDYAYTERKQIKDVFDQMITEFLSNHFDNEKAINGNTWDE